MAATLKRAMMRKVRFHDLRHTFASHLAMASVPIRTIQQLMGHESLDMTLKYAHLTEGHQREAMDKLQHQLQRFRNTQGCSTESRSRVDHFPVRTGSGDGDADE